MAEPHVNGTMCLLRDDFQRGANSRLVIAPSEGDAMTGPTDRAVRPSFNPPPRWHPQPGPHYPVLIRDARHSTVRVILAIAQSRQNNLAATAPSREPERLDAPWKPSERLDQAQPRARSPDLDSLAHAGLLGRCWGRSRAQRWRGVLARLTRRSCQLTLPRRALTRPQLLRPGVSLCEGPSVLWSCSTCSHVIVAPLSA